MQIAQSKTREQFPLSSKKIIKKTISGTLGYIILFLILCVIFVASGFNLYKDFGDRIFGWFVIAGVIVVGLLFLIILLTYFYQRWYFAVYFYDLTDNVVVIRKGPITPKEITIPYERIQDIYVDQDLLDRIFGLYDVHISSATVSSGGAAHIDGVEKWAADGLRAIFLQVVQQRISKKSV